MDILSKFSEGLQELMAERELNQPLLAKALGINNSMISSYITGKCTPSYDTFVMFVEFFHCSADFLLGLKEYPCEEIAYKPVQPFCERLHAVLAETHTTQYAFIKRSRISWSVFYYWLTGKSLPSMDNLVRIAKTLDRSVDYLLGRV